MQRAADAPRPAFTARQGQFLAFIHTYTLVNGRPPAEADMMRFFRLTPPSVHQMVLTLEKAGLISRQPGVARSIVRPARPLRLTRALSRIRSTGQNLCAEVLVGHLA
jgi:DNA-binding MarR family transcriptional regulator